MLLSNLGYLTMFNLEGDLKTGCFWIINIKDGMEGRTRSKEVQFQILSLKDLNKSV